jgi:hypothetical protein
LCLAPPVSLLLPCPPVDLALWRLLIDEVEGLVPGVTGQITVDLAAGSKGTLTVTD